MRRQPTVLREAAIAPNAIRYQLLSHAIAWTCLIVTIPLLPVILTIVWLYYRRYYETLEVVLTTRELQVNRGIVFRQEKSIPLEKITDLAVAQGPVMRRMGLKRLQVETAGQSGAGSALVGIIGLANTDDFREAALDQRDKVADRAVEAAPAAERSSEEMLGQIHATLLRIETALAQGSGEREARSLPDVPGSLAGSGESVDRVRSED